MVEAISEALIECQDCAFSKTVHPDDGTLPADVVVEHGRETGHKLSVGAIADS